MKKSFFSQGMLTTILVMLGSVSLLSCGGDDESPTSPSAQEQDVYWKINDFMRKPYAVRFSGSVLKEMEGTTPAGAIVSYECVFLDVYEFLSDNTVYQYTLHSKECVPTHRDKHIKDSYDKDKEWIELEELKGWYYQDKGKQMTYILNMTKGVLTLSTGEEYIFSYPELPITLKDKKDGKVQYINWYDPNEDVPVISWLELPNI